MKPSNLSYLREVYRNRLKENVPLAGYTSARLGGPADAVIIVRSSNELTEVVSRMWVQDIPFSILGGGSNVLVSDKGIRNLVIINRTRHVEFIETSDPPHVRAESGTTMNDLAQKAAILGLGGLEWAATIPGTLGGAVFGNAGAFKSEISSSLVSADILHREFGKQSWPVGKMEYSYRSSILKRSPQPVIILSAILSLYKSAPEEIRRIMVENSSLRRKNQPSGASMGSVFKNPPGDFAGRLIENTGLKGRRIGNAEISPVHANFIITHGGSYACDVNELICLARLEVEKKFGVTLELEIELLGEW